MCAPWVPAVGEIVPCFLIAGHVEIAVRGLPPEPLDMQHPNVVLLSGGPGCGKSKFAKDFGKGTHALAAELFHGAAYAASAEEMLSRRVEIRTTFANGTPFEKEETALGGDELLAVRALYCCFPLLGRGVTWVAFFKAYRSTGLRFSDVVRCAVESQAAQLGIAAAADGALPPFFVTVVIDEAQVLLDYPAQSSSPKPWYSGCQFVAARS